MISPPVAWRRGWNCVAKPNVYVDEFDSCIIGKRIDGGVFRGWGRYRWFGSAPSATWAAEVSAPDGFRSD